MQWCYFLPIVANGVGNSGVFQMNKTNMFLGKLFAVATIIHSMWICASILGEKNSVTGRSLNTRLLSRINSTSFLT